MIGLDKIRQIFASQFEADGAAFRYRNSMKGPPIRVSEAERDFYLEAFGKSLRHVLWGSIAGVVLLLGSFALYRSEVDPGSPIFSLYIGAAVLVAGAMGVSLRAWTYPARDLERRPIIGNPRSWAEIGRMMLAKLTWGKLATLGAVVFMLTFKLHSFYDLPPEWDRWWVGAAGLAVLIVSIQALWKWRFGISAEEEDPL